MCGVKLNFATIVFKDVEKRYAGSNWEKHFDNETNIMSGKYPSIKGFSPFQQKDLLRSVRIEICYSN